MFIIRFALTGLLFILSTSLCSVFANELDEIDSVQHLIRTETDQTKQVHFLNYIAFCYASVNIDSTFAYIEKATLLAEEISYKQGLAECYLFQAKATAQQGGVTESIIYYNKALELYTELEDSVNILNIYRGLSFTYSFNSDPGRSLEYNLKALHLAESMKDTLSLSIIYNNIAVVYMNVGNYKDALRYFESTLAIERQWNSVKDIATTIGNIGHLNIKSGNIDEASIQFNELRKMIPKVEIDYVVAYLKLSLAGYYIAVEKYDSAKICIDIAEAISESDGHAHIQVRVLRRRGESLYEQGNYAESIKVLKQCIKLSESLGVEKEFPWIFKTIADSYSKLSKFEDAYTYLVKSNEYTDALKLDESAIILSNFEREKQIELEESLELQKADNLALRFQFKYRLLVIGSLLLLLSVIIFIYFNVKVRKRNKLLKQSYQTINEQKQLLEENISKLKLSESSLQKVNSTKDKFFSIIAHDLRSPFNLILNFSNELLDRFDEFTVKEQKDILQIIFDSSKSTFFLLENLLSWARSQSDAIHLSFELINLRDLVDNAIFPYVGNAEMKEIQLDVDISEEINVFADKFSMSIVVANLFNNAVKFTPHKGRITCTAMQQADMVKVIVEDNGIGMSKELVDHLFDLENNIQRLGTNNEKGTGLGLVLCKEFVERNGGYIEVESESGKGSKFCFYLPFSENIKRMG